MWILNSRSGLCVNTSHVLRIFLQDTTDSTLVSAVIAGGDKICTLERYKNHKEAMAAVAQIRWALSEERPVIDLPDSTYYYEERQVKDARTKRRGGS